jgi:hypothetical protein
MRRLTATVLAALATACGERADQPRSLELLPRSAAGPEIRAPGDTQSYATTAAGAPCVRQWPARVQLRGVLDREVHLGPPGYGETPEQDSRDTIAVLALPVTLHVSQDSSAQSGGANCLEVVRLQLVGHPRSALDRLGDTMTVFGTLEERAWGWHYTPVILRVDSIPKPVVPTSRIRAATITTVSPNESLQLRPEVIAEL